MMYQSQDTETFTAAASYNFDHEEAALSGIGGSHDTVSILFQDKPAYPSCKPNIAESGGNPWVKGYQL